MFHPSFINPSTLPPPYLTQEMLKNLISMSMQQQLIPTTTFLPMTTQLPPTIRADVDDYDGDDDESDEKRLIIADESDEKRLMIADESDEKKPSIANFEARRNNSIDVKRQPSVADRELSPKYAQPPRDRSVESVGSSSPSAQLSSPPTFSPSIPTMTSAAATTVGGPMRRRRGRPVVSDSAQSRYAQAYRRKQREKLEQLQSENARLVDELNRLKIEYDKLMRFFFFRLVTPPSAAMMQLN
jgi:hypothetical protein